MLILHEQCPQSIVVRTFEVGDATGRISVKRDQGGRRSMLDPPKERTQFLSPGASLKRGDVTCHETRIDVYDALRAYEAANAGQIRWDSTPITDVGGVYHSTTHFRWERPKVDLSAEPFEVATGAKDAVTGQLFLWRAAIFIQRRKELWLVTVRDISNDTMVDLCSVGVRDLDTGPRLKEDFPLLRLTKAVVGKPQNAWEHLLADDE